jgi:toxin ParE1/3/4
MAIKPLRLILTDEAKAGLRAIRKHIAKESPKAAKIFAKDLTAKLKKLADTGIIDSPRSWVSSDLRGFPYKDRCFYFRIVENKMIVVRVLHSKQDVAAQEFSDITDDG